MAIYTGSGSLTGGANGDIIVSTNPVPLPPPSRPVLLGGDGDDAIVLAHGPVVLENSQAPNNTFASALNIDAAGFWATGNDPLVSDDARPHATVVGTVAPRSSDYFAFTAGSSQAISLDVDFAQRYGGSFNAKLTLYDSSMAVIATTDDSSAGGGGEGSDPGGLDPTLYWIARYTGTYYVKVSASSSFSFDTGSYALSLSVTGHAATGASSSLDESADGQNGDDYIVGGSGNDALYGSAGNDTLYGNAGSDGLHGGAGDDLVNGGDGVDTIYYEAALGGVTVDLGITAAQNTGGDGVDTIASIENVSGSNFDDTITGNNAANVIYGGLGDDRLSGGGGDDRVFVGSYNGIGHDVADGGAGGYDTLVFGVQAGDWTIDLRSGHAAKGAESVDFTNFEAVVGSSSSDTIYAVADRDVAGGDNPDYIYAAGGQSALDGGDFATSSHGGDTVDTTLMLSAGQSFSADLANGLTSVGGLFFSDFDHYVGGAANDDVTGSTASNTIRTGAGDDTVHAGDGSDQIYAGTGTDTVHGEGDDDRVHIAAAAELSAGDVFDGGDGTDLLLIEDGVETDISTVTLSGIERVELAGGHGLTLRADQANGLAELLASTVVLSTAGMVDLQGATLLTSGIRLANGANQVDLSGSSGSGALTVTGGSGADRITGNDAGNVLLGAGGNDTLTGGAGADRLTGGVGADTMAGGLGDDRYEVDNARDRVVESGSAGGYDTVAATVSYTLSARVEALVLIGPHAVAGTGNTSANAITGSSAANTLSGLDGDDRLEGLGGADSLRGGAGADLFVFADVVAGQPGGWGKDAVLDFVHGEDHIDLSGASGVGKYRDLAIKADGDDTVIATGHGDSIRLVGVDAATIRPSDFIFAPAFASSSSAEPPWAPSPDHLTPVHACLA